MGIVILTLICFIIAIITTIIYHYNESGIALGITVVTWIITITFTLASFAFFTETLEDPQCYNEYLSLETLKSSVESSDDEALRFYYYVQVEKYNKDYDGWKNNRESFWFSWITGNKYNNCERIEFELRSGDSSGLESEVPLD